MHGGMRRLRLAPALLGLLALPWALASRAALPDVEELRQRVEAAAPQAAALGLQLRLDGSGLSALRQRTPLVAQHRPGRCQLDYSAYTPGRDFGWLFPALPAAQRRWWLDGVVQHELAHCAERAAATAAPPEDAATLADGARAGSAAERSRWHEVLADLAFALHLERAGPAGPALVGRLAELRAAQRTLDPAHDTARELACFLALPRPLPADADWLATLRALRARCWQPQA